MKNEEAVSRERLVETVNRNKSADNRMIYPTATHFDDLFHSGIPNEETQPSGWEKPWVFDDPEGENGSMACATIGPYCSVSNGIDLWVSPREHLLDSIKSRMCGITGDEIYFDIVHKGNLAVVSAKHHEIARRQLLATIMWSSVPHQDN